LGNALIDPETGATMACLLLWHEDASAAERDAVEAAHRDAVTDDV
jgi:hypothetical protein